MSGEAFFDTNVLLYLLIPDETRSAQAEAVLAGGGTISVQVLNEFVAVARRKSPARLDQIEDLLIGLRSVCKIEPVTLQSHERALALMKRYGMSIYDATIAASALLAGCTRLYTEDFQHGQKLEGLTIVNPFR